MLIIKYLVGLYKNFHLKKEERKKKEIKKGKKCKEKKEKEKGKKEIKKNCEKEKQRSETNFFSVKSFPSRGLALKFLDICKEREKIKISRHLWKKNITFSAIEMLHLCLSLKTAFLRFV